MPGEPPFRRASRVRQYQPGYDGLPVGGKGLPHSTAAQAPWRTAKPFSGRCVAAASVLLRHPRRGHVRLGKTWLRNRTEIIGDLSTAACRDGGAPPRSASLEANPATHCNIENDSILQQSRHLAPSRKTRKIARPPEPGRARSPSAPHSGAPRAPAARRRLSLRDVLRFSNGLSPTIVTRPFPLWGWRSTPCRQSDPSGVFESGKRENRNGCHSKPSFADDRHIPSPLPVFLIDISILPRTMMPRESAKLVSGKTPLNPPEVSKAEIRVCGRNARLWPGAAIPQSVSTRR